MSIKAEPSSIVRLENVYRTFEMGDVQVPVLKGISLEIAEAELLAIVGPSGSGKSTVLNLMGGLDQPTAGHIYFKDFQVDAASRSQLNRYRREQVGFVFQFYNLVPNLTALENIRIATDICEQPMDAEEALRMVGLDDRRDHFPAQLSGGEQQRVAIARAVAKRPQLLLCDEPTGALDFRTGKTVLRLLLDLNSQLGTTLLIITHNGALASVVPRVIHLQSGEVREIVYNEHPVLPEEVQW